MIKAFQIIDTYTNDSGENGYVVMNDEDRVTKNFDDLYPLVILNREIYKTLRVESNQIYKVRKKTRIIIYIE
jgi:hypothetical protein